MVTILKSEVRQAREGHGARVRHAEPREEPELWTWALVRDELVEVAMLWWRSPGDGASGYAADAPWHLMTREDAKADWDARGVDGKSSDVPIKSLPLTCEEVDRRDRVSLWLKHIAEPDDRRIVVLAVGQLATGRATVSWKRVRRAMRIPFGEFGIRKRYERALTSIVEALNGAEIRRSR